MEKDPLYEQLCFLMYVASKETIKQYTPKLKKYDLTYTGYIVMLAMKTNEEITVKDLGKKVFLDSGTLTPLLKKLEKNGYITRERSSQDERQLLVKMTEKGSEIHGQLPCISEEVFRDMNIDKDDFVTLRRILHKFISKSE